MIQEHYMRSAIPINGKERIVGYYYSYIRDDNGKREHCILQDSNSLASDFKINYIDPETVEPIKVKPIKDEDFERGWKCPSCRGAVDEDFEQYGFCQWCGMALDWEDD